MRIPRDSYLDQLVSRQGNGLVKVITGIRRCGKSYLLFTLFQEHLLSSGVDPRSIITLALDDRRNLKLRDPDELLKYLDAKTAGLAQCYILLDEIQLVPEFEDVLNSLLHIPGADIYVTGSNSKFLSTDVITEFRGRGDEIRLHPFSFREFLQAYQGNPEQAWDDYLIYGGLPLVITRDNPAEKAQYLEQLFQVVYREDMINRFQIRDTADFDELVKVLASNVGSLTNPNRLANIFRSRKSTLSDKTISLYLDYLADAFLVSRATRFDLKGNNYIDSPFKYYFEDTGLRNALLGFRQVEDNHLMENIIYNELRIRGFSVDVGVLPTWGKNREQKTVRSLLEVDFVANRGSQRYYLQSAWSLAASEKQAQEKRPLLGIDDSFKKIIVTRGRLKPRHDNHGITTMGVWDFLVSPDSLDF